MPEEAKTSVHNEGYDALREALADDIALSTQARSFFMALFSGDNPDADLVENLDTRATYGRAVRDGRSYVEILKANRYSIQSETRYFLKKSYASIIDRLEQTERQYLRMLNKYRHLPIVTYRARTEHQMLIAREAVVHDLREPAANARQALDSSTFRRRVEAYWAGLDKLKDITVQLADQMVTWEKYRDDRSRLAVAIAGLCMTLMLFAIAQVFIAMRSEGSGERYNVRVYLVRGR